jgi:hypothetical protein
LAGSNTDLSPSQSGLYGYKYYSGKHLRLRRYIRRPSCRQHR